MRINKTPRVTLAVISMAKARAYVAGRDYVIPDDIKYVYPTTITHRLLITAEANASGKTAGDITDEIISMTAPPVVF